MAEDRRARRLTVHGDVPQRTLDPSSAAPPPTAPVEPPELLEPPPPLHAAAQLEGRQWRWFERREAAIKLRPGTPTSSSDPEGGSSSDPKG